MTDKADSIRASRLAGELRVSDVEDLVAMVRVVRIETHSDLPGKSETDELESIRLLRQIVAETTAEDSIYRSAT
jgi:hypothetical protein